MSARAYAKDKGYTGSALYYWLRRGQQDRPKAGGISFARVVRSPLPAPRKQPESPASVGVPILLELGGARLILRPGFDRTALATVLDLLEERQRVVAS